MALDAATLALTAAELKATLTDAKIAKIFEPTRDELVITLRTRTDTYALLLSARSGSARVCLTEETFENPETPPSFCMLMRKHLTGGRLLDVHMEPGDRIVYFDFQCTNEMGDLVRNTLCAELMGRYSNLVLVQSGKIIDALKRVDFEDSDVRQLLPGLPYTIPPKPARPDFLQVSAASIVAAACERDLPVADALNKTAVELALDKQTVHNRSDVGNAGELLHLYLARLGIHHHLRQEYAVHIRCKGLALGGVLIHGVIGAVCGGPVAVHLGLYTLRLHLVVCAVASVLLAHCGEKVLRGETAGVARHHLGAGAAGGAGIGAYLCVVHYEAYLLRPYAGLSQRLVGGYQLSLIHI